MNRDTKYRTMAFDETSSGNIIVPCDRWHDTMTAAMDDAHACLDSERVVVFEERWTSRHVLTQTLIWESHPETIKWLNADRVEEDYKRRELARNGGV